MQIVVQARQFAPAIDLHHSFRHLILTDTLADLCERCLNNWRNAFERDTRIGAFPLDFALHWRCDFYAIAERQNEW